MADFLVGDVDAVLRDPNGNAVGVVIDGAVYRLQTETKLATGHGLATETTLAALNAKMVEDNVGALTTINVEHHQIHEGRHFSIIDWIEVSGEGTSYELLLQTPATGYHHMFWTFTAGAAFAYLIFEDVTTSDDGTSITPVNSKRDSVTAPALTVFHTPTVTDDGTELYHSQISSGGKSGASVASTNEIILGLSKKYLIRLTKRDAGTEFLSYSLRWYE